MKPEIIPAILPKDFAELEEKLALITGLAKTVQIDICDGQFVPNATWPYKKKDDTFEKIIHEEEGLPGWEKLNFEMDLMVNKPEEVVEQWVTAGANRIIIHVESKGDIMAAINFLQGKVEIGLALAMETPIETIEQYKDKIQSIQLMGIDRIGLQGQEFDEKVIGRVKHAHLLYPGFPISVDGGVSLDSAPQLMAAGVSRLVVGSALFNSDNIVETMQRFKKL